MLVTNISRVTLSRTARTRARLEQAALDLFERQGFEQTTVGQIADAAGVTQMTFFRHFAAKSRVLFDDPYDPVVATAVAEEDSTLDPLTRIARAIRTAWASLPEPEDDLVRRKVRVVARTPGLASEMTANNATTERLIVEALVQDGVERLVARAAAAAAMAAITAALLEWGVRDDLTLGAALQVALDTLERRDG